MPTVTAVIPHYKRKDQLTRCLAALDASTVPVDRFVHDNTDRNIGFTAAVNLGLRSAIERRFDYSLVLNQDCYVRPDTVARLIEFMESHPQCAIAGPKQVHGRDEDAIIHAGCAAAYPAGRHYTGRKSAGQHTVDRPMPWVNGAALFARTSAFIDFGLMDANMVIIGSDSDWCYAARARGYQVWYCAAAEVVHDMGVSSEPPPELAEQFRLDMTWWRDKWIGTTLYRKLSSEFSAT